MPEYKDSVKDQTTSTGTGTITVDSVAPVGFRSIADAHVTGAKVSYRISKPDQSEWEVGSGIWTESNSTLTRDVVYASSNSGELVSFSAGTKTVITTVVAADFNSIGEIKVYAGVSVPEGHLACEGQLLSVSSYPLLFAVINNTYGGDGITTFALPNYRRIGAGKKHIICVDYYPAPPVHSVTVPAAIHGPVPGVYYAGDTLSFTVQLLDDIAITGGPVSLDITVGVASHSLLFVSGTAREWAFSDYTLPAGEVGDVTATLNLNGAVLTSGGVTAALSMSCMPSGIIAAIPLSGAAQASSSAAGQVNQSTSMAGSAQADGAAVGDINQSTTLSGNAQANVSASGDLT